MVGCTAVRFPSLVANWCLLEPRLDQQKSCIILSSSCSFPLHCSPPLTGSLVSSHNSLTLWLFNNDLIGHNKNKLRDTGIINCKGNIRVGDRRQKPVFFFFFTWTDNVLAPRKGQTALLTTCFAFPEPNEQLRKLGYTCSSQVSSKCNTKCRSFNCA